MIISDLSNEIRVEINRNIKLAEEKKKETGPRPRFVNSYHTGN